MLKYYTTFDRSSICVCVSFDRKQKHTNKQTRILVHEAPARLQRLVRAFELVGKCNVLFCSLEKSHKKSKQTILHAKAQPSTQPQNEKHTSAQTHTHNLTYAPIDERTRLAENMQVTEPFQCCIFQREIYTQSTKPKPKPETNEQFKSNAFSFEMNFSLRHCFHGKVPQITYPELFRIQVHNFYARLIIIVLFLFRSMCA